MVKLELRIPVESSLPYYVTFWGKFWRGGDHTHEYHVGREAYMEAIEGAEEGNIWWASIADYEGDDAASEITNNTQNIFVQESVSPGLHKLFEDDAHSYLPKSRISWIIEDVKEHLDKDNAIKSTITAAAECQFSRREIFHDNGSHAPSHKTEKQDCLSLPMVGGRHA